MITFCGKVLTLTKGDFEFVQPIADPVSQVRLNRRLSSFHLVLVVKRSCIAVSDGLQDIIGRAPFA